MNTSADHRQPAEKRKHRCRARDPHSGRAIGYRRAHVYGEHAEELTRDLLDDRPDLVGYPEAVAAWATAEAQVTVVRQHVANNGGPALLLDPEAPRIYQVLSWAEQHAERCRKALGLDPYAEARLTKDRAVASASSTMAATALDSLAAQGAQHVAHAHLLPVPELPPGGASRSGGAGDAS